jgi:acyl carrier protein
VTDSLADRVIAVIAHTQRVPVETISLDQTFADLGIQSLERLNMLFALEDEFNITIPDEQAAGILDVRGVIEGVERLVAEQASSRPPGA